ncbi:hypothetical protein Lfu02_73170 [Longispora fulva]|uniref:Uncharacterized protein n=1 Tax=Longispora fulva TaxID=619741 RepID=A0A8J7GGD5_9ACTN|nr:hypothetical protein [Longispora fulva]MBG6133904.1 hypothetical protein [Longispora fulva]GIG62945.1 hypothetical protein Lfu02_73170 [Longispora fulva]
MTVDPCRPLPWPSLPDLVTAAQGPTAPGRTRPTQGAAITGKFQRQNTISFQGRLAAPIVMKHGADGQAYACVKVIENVRAPISGEARALSHVPEPFYGMVGRVVMLAALLELRILDLLTELDQQVKPITVDDDWLRKLIGEFVALPSELDALRERAPAARNPAS